MVLLCFLSFLFNVYGFDLNSSFLESRREKSLDVEDPFESVLHVPTSTASLAKIENEGDIPPLNAANLQPPQYVVMSSETVKKRFVSDQEFRCYLCIGSVFGSCIDFVNLWRSAPLQQLLSSPMQLAVYFLMCPLCLLPRCLCVEQTPHRKRIDLKDAVHCRPWVCCAGSTLSHFALSDMIGECCSCKSDAEKIFWDNMKKSLKESDKKDFEDYEELMKNKV